MKNQSQILRYVTQCSFTERDWRRVQAWCERFPAVRKTMRRALSPLSASTYGQFLDWLDNGLGSGEVVDYRGERWIVGSDTPEGAYLVGCFNSDGVFVPKGIPSPKMDRNASNAPLCVKNADDLARVSESERASFLKAMRRQGYDFSQRFGAVTKKYVPKRLEWIACEEIGSEPERLGIYLESSEGKDKCLALYGNGVLELDCCCEPDEVSYRPVKAKEREVLDKAIRDSGYEYDDCLGYLRRIPPKSKSGYYWYVTDRFEAAKDKEDENARHFQRRRAGNYFAYLEDALFFISSIKKIRGEI